MSHFIYIIFIFYFIGIPCQALNCRSEGGPKEEDLKAIYNTCQKKQERHNSSDNRGYEDDEEWKDSNGHSNQKKLWNKDLRHKQGESDIEERDDRTNNRNRFGSRDDRTNSRDNRMGNRDDRNSGKDDRQGEIGGRDYMHRNHNVMSKTDGFEDQFNDRHNYGHSDDYDSNMHGYGQHSTSQPSRRFKRSKRIGNSGQRSQYNPNSKKRVEHEERYQDDDRNTNNTSREMDHKSCALHCFMEQLEMTGDNGMPDRYLVTHAITKDVKNEDLRDFLQESIEECFQILDNENTEDKCEFAKNLMMCLSEKGRANCDDWKDDLKF